jgi:hypothetical protein
MFVNSKMIPVETIPGMRGRGYGRMMERVNSCMTYFTHCKNFCKCHNVPPLSTMKKKKKAIS